MSIERDYLSGKGSFYGKTITTVQQKALLNELSELERRMIERHKHYRYSDTENKEYFDTEFFKITERHHFANQAVADKLKQSIEALKKKYLAERDPVREGLELRRWELRYAAMNREQLIAEAGRYVREPGIAWNGDRLDALNAALTGAGVDKIGTAPRSPDGTESGPVTEKSFSEWIEHCHGREPWFFLQPELVRALELYSPPFGFMRILDENGSVEEFRIAAAVEIKLGQQH